MVLRTDAERFVARKAQALGDDAGPCHHDGRTVHDGEFVPERVLVQQLVKVEAAARRAFFDFVRSITGPGQKLVLERPRRRAVATFAPFSRWRWRWRWR